ncbi:MAG: methyltransferase protein [Solirubrobacterales bacterium]|nr:methyltransferase protein [Solirubrobacterales bacterium]
MDASYVDLADAQHLEFDYLRWARIVLNAVRASRVLHVGGAGCALPRALAAADVGTRHEVVEIDPVVLDVARRHLGLRRMPGLKVRVGDGRERIAARAGDSADAIVVDAFVGARVPRHLVTVEAFADAHRVAPLMLVNIVDTRSLIDTRAIAVALASAYPQIAALGSRGLRGGNMVLIGAAFTPPLDRIAARAAADRSPARLVMPADLHRLIRGQAPARDPG